MQFVDLNISEVIKKSISKLGFLELTEVQELVIPKAILGIDIIAQAPTGTGKTCAFGIPILERIKYNDLLQSLILAPTRELAMQITADIKSFASLNKNLRIVCVYGGEEISKQIKSLKKSPQIIVATPGRLLDHINRGTIDLSSISEVVIDEADEMLKMGFIEDVNKILSLTGTRHTMLFSATFPKEIKKICDNYLHDAITIKVASKSLTVDKVKQYYCLVNEKDKIEVISRLIDINGYELVMIFCNTKKDVDIVYSKLMQKGYFVEALHGDMHQEQRDRVMMRFRERKLNILVASDVASRGLDVDDIDAIINYDLPLEEEFYVHRIGRTARANKEGVAISLVTNNEMYRLKAIQIYAKATISFLSIPDLSLTLKKRSRDIIEKALKNNNSEYKNVVETVVKKELALSSLNPIDIISGLIMLQMDMGEDVEKVMPKVVKKKGNVRLFINLGKTHGLNRSDLVNIIDSFSKIKKNDIKTMEVHDDFSFFEVDSVNLDKVINAFVREKYNNKRIIVEVAKEKSKKK